jgi:hypothetical protein
MGVVVAAKVKCPSCGAKNPDSNRRCRVCAAIINMSIPEPGKGGSAEPTAPLDDVFDASAINNQMRPAAARFSSAGGGLGARIAAAQGQTPPAGPAAAPAPAGPAAPPIGPTRSPAPTPEPAFGDPGDAIVFETPTRNAPTPPPIEYEAEKFDPNALFGDDA